MVLPIAERRSDASRNPGAGVYQIQAPFTPTEGPDTFAGGGGHDTVYGGGGNDTFYGGGGNDTFYGGGGDDELSGHSDNDWLDGGDGKDLLIGDTGNDMLIGGAGNDVLLGQLGNDTLDGGTGADLLVGGNGDDTYIIRGAGASISEDEGLDAGFDRVLVLTGSFRLEDWLGIEVIQAGEGLGFGQVLTGNNLDNTVIGGAYSDSLSGGGGNDRLFGGAGNDTLDGGQGGDYLNGGVGDDVYRVDNPGDYIDEGAGGGVDTVLASFSFTLNGNLENLQATGTAGLILVGNAFANFIAGNAGANTLDGGSGKDTLDGGAGADILRGGKDADRLYGGTGGDWLQGGLGKDVLHGGTGKDFFFFDTKLNKRKNVDKIVDFKVKDDTIMLDNKYMPKLGKKGSLKKPLRLKKDAFYLGPKAKDEEDRILYSKKSGYLYYDPDGTDSKSPIKIAKLSKKLKMTYKDFYII